MWINTLIREHLSLLKDYLSVSTIKFTKQKQKKQIDMVYIVKIPYYKNKGHWIWTGFITKRDQGSLGVVLVRNPYYPNRQTFQ